MFPTITTFDAVAATTTRPTEPDYALWGCVLRDRILCMPPSAWQSLLEQAAANPRDTALDMLAQGIRMIDGWLAHDAPAVYARMQRDDSSPVDTWTAMADELRVAEWRARRGERLT